jgi:hypothetical protein
MGDGNECRRENLGHDQTHHTEKDKFHIHNTAKHEIHDHTVTHHGPGNKSSTTTGKDERTTSHGQKSKKIPKKLKNSLEFGTVIPGLRHSKDNGGGK